MKNYTCMLFLVFYTLKIIIARTTGFIFLNIYKIAKAEATEDYVEVADLYKEFIVQKLIGSY